MRTKILKLGERGFLLFGGHGAGASGSATGEMLNLFRFEHASRFSDVIDLPSL